MKIADRLLAAFRSESTDVHISYAMKANCDPAIVRLLQQKGYGLDCVSSGELRIALDQGVSPDKIPYPRNYESYADLEAAF